MIYKAIKKFYKSSELGYALIHPIYKTFYYLKYDLESDKKFIEQRFKRVFGRELDLENPQTLNEKINWLKLNDRTPLHTQCADKYAVREYIANKIGKNYLIPLFFQTEDPREIVPQNLPEEPCIIKTNHDSGGVFIVRDKSDIDYKNVQLTLRRFLRNNYYQISKEWQYKNIAPCIIVEKLLLNKKGQIPFDYKIHCFNGRAKFTQVDLDRQTNHTRNLYDRDWNFIPCEWKYRNGREIVEPVHYEKMVKLAEKIAQDFVYVRVDFYAIENYIYFGELTFHSESGTSKFEPPEYDKKFGDFLRLPIEESKGKTESTPS